ncbi:Sec63 Brl domain-containing protein [Pyronema omphalodes]|nr:Sec63 Brl domain-containing protein [Pyronema omphalodes]
MSTDYSYDDKGQFFPYFVATILGLILVPLSYSTFAPSQQLRASNKPLITSPDYDPPRYEKVEAARRRQAKKERRLKRFTALVFGWAALGYVCYLISISTNPEGNVWDPYTILGIGTSATEKAIKSHYKKMSLKFHPDKIRPGPNETIEMLNERFVEITKAYKALTDEEMRNNYIEYGHPDGKQPTSIGIALPKWVVSEGNTYYVLMVYGLLFGILLPYTVGKWWYGTKKLTKDGVVVESAGKLFKEYDEDMDEAQLVRILTAGQEVKEITSGAREKEWANSEDATIEKKLLAAGLRPSQLGALEKYEGWRRRAITLLWAYLYRIDLGNDALDIAKLDVAAAAITLNRSVNSICMAFGNLGPLLTSLRLSQFIIQAIAPGQSPLLQLPHFTEAIADAVEREGGKNHWTVAALMSLPEKERKARLIGPGLLTEPQYKTAMTFAKAMPALKVEAAFFKVVGEKAITPSSLITFVVKARVIPPGVTAPAVNPKDLLDEDPDESDIEALLGRKKGEKSKDAIAAAGQLPLAHAPFYPRDHHPGWYVFLGDVRQGKIVVPPTPVTSFDKDPAGFTVVTTKMQFQAPPQEGEFPFTMFCVSDTYIGVETQMSVTLKVQEASAGEWEDVDDISEPDEDSIAGQMNAMRGGAAPPKKKKKSAAAAKEESDSEEEDSDTDGAEEISDTDTETEDEGDS